MKKISPKASVCAFVLAVFLSFALSSAHAAPGTPVKMEETSSTEDWKGAPEDSAVMFGALSGLALVDGTAGFTLLGTASKKIVAQGFAPDIANSVSIETEMGPIFIQGATVFAFNFHLRWDFQKDKELTFYALGGLGGNVQGASRGDRFELFPRFGIGMLWDIFPNLLVRAELSHEFIVAGVSVPLWF